MSDPGPTTSAAAARIAGLVQKLLPLGDTAPGELITADDWNAVVGALIEVARAVLAEGPADTVPAHTHADQVGVGWLDENLRHLLERGPLSDPAVETRVGGLERQASLLASRLERLNGGVDSVRQQISSVAANDLVRANDVATVRRSVDGIGDSRIDVAQLRSSLSDLQTGVATAVSVSQRLVVDGQPVDMGAVIDRLKAVEGLKSQLTLPSGEAFDAHVLDQRLTLLQQDGVSKDELASALANHTATISADQLTALRQGATADAVAAVGPSITAATDQVRNDVSGQLANVDAKISAAIGDQQAATISAALAAMRPELAAAVSKASDQLTAAIAQQVGTSADALRADLGGRIDRVTAGLSSAVTAEVNRQVGTRLDGLNSTIASLSSRLDKAEVRMGAHDTVLTQLGTQIAQAARDDAVARDALAASMKAELDRRDQVNASALDDRFAKADAVNQQRISQAVIDSQRSIIGQIQDIATKAAAVQIDQTATQLRSEMHSVAQNEIAASGGTVRKPIGTVVTPVTPISPVVVNPIQPGRIIDR